MFDRVSGLVQVELFAREVELWKQTQHAWDVERLRVLQRADSADDLVAHDFLHDDCEEQTNERRDYLYVNRLTWHTFVKTLFL